MKFMFDNIRAEMRRHNKTNADVGKMLGITPNSVSFKLNGKRPFTLEEIRRLAEEFDCSLDYLAIRGNQQPA